MHRTVSATLSEYQKVVQSLSILAKTVQRYDGLMQQIEDKEIEIRNAVLGKVSSKRQMRKELIAKMKSLANSLKAYAAFTRNPELLEHAKMSLSLSNIRDTELVTCAANLVERMQAVLPQLGEYDVQTEAISDLRNKADLFAGALGAKQSALARRIAAEGTIDDLTRQTDELLKLEMDPLVDSQQEKHPEFVAAYHAARKIWDLGMRGRKKEPPAEVIPPAE